MQTWTRCVICFDLFSAVADCLGFWYESCWWENTKGIVIIPHETHSLDSEAYDRVQSRAKYSLLYAPN
jgi:hypothetical protein